MSFYEMSLLRFCFIFMLLRVSFQAKILHSDSLICDPNDFSALEDFTKHLQSRIEGWDIVSGDCCNWTGVTCNSSSFPSLNDTGNTGRVVKLELGRMRISGNLSESLGNLDQLRTLNLSHNFLKGHIPPSLLHLQLVEILDLSYNDISGSFTSSINLPSIKILNLSENSIRGAVPVGICSNSTKISVMNLEVNFFGGRLPVGLGNCSLLEDLSLATNFLVGDIPQDLYQLSSLRKLSLQENRFSGELSPDIGNLSNLVRLDLAFNELSGSIPDVFHRFTSMTYFSAQSNSLSGRMPTSLTNSQTIMSLSLRNNSLVGTIDFNCTAMVNLVSLDLATNNFQGKVPDNLPGCPRLKTINFGRINFTGQVPESFKNFQSLSYLSLSNTGVSNLESALQILQHCKNLTTLVLTLNFRDEEMPNFSTLEFTGLKALVVANCRLTGVLPQWLRSSTKLQLLDLSWNLLEGSIPPWFGNFSSLFYLDLSNNSFTGEIPKELTTLPSLISGDIRVEEPSPDFTFFMKKNVSLRGYPYRQILSFPPTLELGNNFLTGQIWPEFGNLKELHVFDLQSNNLSGTIPNSLSGMRSLETLDLSFNNLVGVIPPSLTALSFLSRFSVAHNNLSGPIPRGGQFETFPSSSFDGNMQLCSEHASRSCSHSSSKQNPDRSKKRLRGATIAMAVGIGLGFVSLFAVLFVLYFWAVRRKVVDPEMEDAGTEELGHPSLVILCQNKEDEKEIFLDELVKATNDFDSSNIIGCGGFGLVYKAVLSDGRKVAIKRLSGEYCQMEREFHAEIETLSRAQHPNLVPLQGYCKYKTDKLLIYSYMENGSLDYWLHERTGASSLDWKTRFQIAQGCARGLAYLHQSCEPHILHRDIKSSNILLNDKLEAHLADFGLARLILPYDTHVSTDLVGTLGYIPPEYSQASVATYKGDIYSFGVVLLELLTSRRPMDMSRPKGHLDLISWAIHMRKEKREIQVFDPFIYDKEHEREMATTFEIACLCLSERPRARPCAQHLVSWLHNIALPSTTASVQNWLSHS